MHDGLLAHAGGDTRLSNAVVLLRPSLSLFARGMSQRIIEGGEMMMVHAPPLTTALAISLCPTGGNSSKKLPHFWPFVCHFAVNV